MRPQNDAVGFGPHGEYSFFHAHHATCESTVTTYACKSGKPLALGIRLFLYLEALVDQYHINEKRLYQMQILLG